jgi:hypothetical protein
MLRRFVAVVLAAGLVSFGDAPVRAFVPGPKPLLGAMCLSLFRTTAVLNEGNSTVTTFDPQSGFDAAPANVLTGPHTALRAPRGFAYGANGRIVVGVPSRGAILRFDPAGGGGAQATGDVAPRAAITGAQSPLGFSVTETTLGANSQLYLADDVSGTALSVPFLSTGHGQFTTLASGIVRPDATMIDRLGNLWVASYGSSTVSRFAPGSVTPNLTITTGISGPFALARGYWDTVAAPNVPIESLFVTNFLSNAVGIYDINTGAPVTQISNFVDHPTGIAYDQNLDMIAVASYNTDSVVEFFAPPTLAVNAVAYLGGPHTRLNHPVALWFGDSPSNIPNVQTDVAGTPHRDVDYPAAGATLAAMERARRDHLRYRSRPQRDRRDFGGRCGNVGNRPDTQRGAERSDGRSGRPGVVRRTKRGQNRQIHAAEFVRRVSDSESRSAARHRVHQLGQTLRDATGAA